MSQTPLWISEEEAYARFGDTLRRLETVLELARLSGVTGSEMASILASLHVRAVARLHPNEQQREHVVAVFREALDTHVADCEAGRVV